MPVLELKPQDYAAVDAHLRSKAEFVRQCGRYDLTDAVHTINAVLNEARLASSSTDWKVLSMAADILSRIHNDRPRS